MIEKLQLVHQYQEKQKLIVAQKEEIARLQQRKSEIEIRIEKYNKDNQTIITKTIPDTLEVVQIQASASEHLDTLNKEDVLKHLQGQFHIIEEAVTKYQEIAHPDKTQKLLNFLQAVQNHLNLGFNAYDSSELARLANGSGLPSRKNPANTGFNLMLEILGEDPSHYFLTWKSTDYKKLSTIVPQKIEAQEFAHNEDNRYLESLSNTSKTLEQLKSKLTSNFEERDKLAAEVSELSLQITKIDTVTIRELEEQATVLDQKIKEIEQNEEQDRQRAREQQQELERQQRLQQEELVRQEELKQPRVILATEFKRMLENYKQERNQNKYYRAKDYFDATDKEFREQFIDELVNENTGLFKTYVDTGNSDALLKKIMTQIDEFPGVKLQATLSRIAVKLMDADAKPEAVDNRSTQVRQALSALKRKKGKEEQYALKMLDLYGKITDIERYARTLPEPQNGIIARLAADLTQDVDQFVYQNKAGLPNKVAYQQFEMKVKARLHSQDDVMSGHRPWYFIAGNLLFSLATLAKLVCSKVLTGRATLFFDKTAAQKEIEAPVDEALEDIRTLFEI
ncbi:hypothetical protein OQJ13_09245 [Legionella sp. PATHC035]|uniref:hypothetical protein n=1 Tax=Legionella sp. PATHC035 TaxID=2992040 RepID=UPI002244D975|nr:hypothetical protein [Legionella sp. PATHC035]MCW8409156.1 hypothetical protein [Legionella sp. PATHC035]